ncbi:CDP-alcohol phosphatidyltransferase family protein [bacterium]|nr:CDP-alcohol phosphatidyltransferase family protein [bacterium]
MANWITLSRILITFLSLYFLFIGTTEAMITAVSLLVLQFILDGVDGYVARKFHEESKLGAALDIMSDRIAENAYWISFAVLGWISVSFPIIILTRTIIVDCLRSAAMAKGYTAFGKDSMQKDPVGQFICCSKFMRILFAVMKMLAFILLVIAYIPSLNIFAACLINVAGCVCAVAAVMLCVLRGLPVIFESKELFVEEKTEEAKAE